MANVIKPPSPLKFDMKYPSLFLAGSIEMGHAENWQSRVESAFSNSNIVILNPRRDAWDSSWEQSINNPTFKEQVEWELEAQELATLIMMYFAPTTKAPITLLELGLSARSGKLVVCCPDGYWRKGNVEVVCTKYKVPMVANIDELISYAQETF
jgi:hypothetical protein